MKVKHVYMTVSIPEGCGGESVYMGGESVGGESMGGDLWVGLKQKWVGENKKNCLCG